MDDTVIPLADAFPAATRDAWLALVDKTIKGAPIESLNSRTAGGAALQPLYVSGDVAPSQTVEPAPLPAERTAEGGWDLRFTTRHPDPATANAEILEALAGGAVSAGIRIDPTGAHGVAIGSAADLARVLDGVMTDVAPVALDAGFLGERAGEWLAAAAKSAPGAPIQLNIDPIGALAVSGHFPGPIRGHIEACAKLAARAFQTYPKASLFLASGQFVHEAGGSEADEIAVALTNGHDYVNDLARAGVPFPQAFERVTLGLAVDGEYFTGIAKLRALRRLWSHLAWASNVGPVRARIEARASRRMLTRADAWTNMIRLTAAGFAAAVGGADIIDLGAFTDAIGLPTAFARRQARNAQLILMEEAYLGRVADPAAGAWYLEKLTADLASAAWTRFQEMQPYGGVLTALLNGALGERVEASRAELQRRLKAGELTVLGVTRFQNADDQPPEVETATPTPVTAPDLRVPGVDTLCQPLRPVRLEELCA